MSGNSAIFLEDDMVYVDMAVVVTAPATLLRMTGRAHGGSVQDHSACAVVE